MIEVLFRFKKLFVIIFLLLIFLSSYNIVIAKEPKAVRRIIEGTEYELLMPGDYESEKTYSLIIAMHGSNGKIEWISDYWYSSGATDKGFFVACPQLPSHFLYDEIFSKIEAIAKDISLNYSVNSKDLYITGFSMGAENAIYYAIANPDKVKAVAMASGQIRESVLNSPRYNKSNIRKLNVLVLCGKLDDVNRFYTGVVNYLKKYKANVKSELTECLHDYDIRPVLKTLEYFENIKSSSPAPK